MADWDGWRKRVSKSELSVRLDDDKNRNDIIQPIAGGVAFFLIKHNEAYYKVSAGPDVLFRIRVLNTRAAEKGSS